MKKIKKSITQLSLLALLAITAAPLTGFAQASQESYTLEQFEFNDDVEVLKVYPERGTMLVKFTDQHGHVQIRETGIKGGLRMIKKQSTAKPNGHIVDAYQKIAKKRLPVSKR